MFIVKPKQNLSIKNISFSALIVLIICIVCAVSIWHKFAYPKNANQDEDDYILEFRK